MNLNRQLARLMAAVIVMIAAYVWPSVAQAHEGHAHAPAVSITYAQSAPAAGVSKAAKASPARLVKAQALTSAVTVAEARSRVSAPVGRSCNGLCCSMGMSCSAGMSCCAPGLLPGGEVVHFSSVSGVRLIAPETPVFSDIALEALPKPPKSFA